MIQIAETKDGKQVTKERMQEFKKKVVKKEQTDNTEFVKQLATRAKLERDYQEDQIHVTFNSSPETKRTILARRPSKSEFLEILNLSIQAAKFEGMGDAQSLEKLGKIYSGLHKIAAKLSIDKTLNEEFWDTKVSMTTLQNFIGELVNASQQLGSGGIAESEFKKFRGK